MKLYVISDTHGFIDDAVDTYEQLDSIDLILHLGDYQRDALRIAELTGKKVISVPGNTDGSSSKEDYHILETEYGSLLLAHGHMHGVKYGMIKLLYWARELNCKAVLFGHTHIPVYTESEGIYLVNPGSLTAPYDGTMGSYAIVNTAKDSFSASIVYVR